MRSLCKGILKAVIATIYLSLAVLTLLLSSPLLLSQGSSWTLLSSEVSKSAALYDNDLDGVPDMLATDSSLYLNLTTRVPAVAIPFKFDLNATGVLCLALYRPDDGFLAIKCPYGYYTYSAPVNALARVYRYGVLLHNATKSTAIVAGKHYDTLFSGVPLVVDGKPAVLGLYEGYVALHYLGTALVEKIAPVNISIAEALLSKTLIYGVGLAEGRALFFTYNVTSKAFTLKPLAVESFETAVAVGDRIYILSRGGALYAVDRTGNVIGIASGVLKLFYPADSVNSFTALTSNRILKVNSLGIASEYPAPPSSIYAIDWCGDVLAASTASGVFIATTRPLYASIQAPRAVYAGELTEIRVSGIYETAVIRIGDRVWSTRGAVVLREALPPGNISIMVKACRGLFCIENSSSVLVLRRPLEVRVRYPQVVRPYDTMEVFVEAVDKLWNRSVSVNCSIRDPSNRLALYLTSGQGIAVPALPDVDSSVFVVSCGGGYYDTAQAIVRARLSEPYLKIGLKYYGSGLLELYGYNKFTGEVWNHSVVVKYLNITVSGRGRALITLPPGETTLRVLLMRGNTTYYVEELKVKYYEDVMKAPTGEPVILADRVKIEVYTMTETITRQFPVYYEVRTVDPMVIAVTAAFTAGCVYAILMLLGKLPKIRK